MYLPCLKSLFIIILPFYKVHLYGACWRKDPLKQAKRKQNKTPLFLQITKAFLKRSKPVLLASTYFSRSMLHFPCFFKGVLFKQGSIFRVMPVYCKKREKK